MRPALAPMDGSASGLDADMLDGKHASAFAPATLIQIVEALKERLAALEHDKADQAARIALLESKLEMLIHEQHEKHKH